MNRRAHAIGRGLACLGLASTGAYLGWRITSWPGNTPKWLVIVALAIEIVGFCGSLLLTWARWPGQRSPAPSGLVEPRQVDVVVRVDRQPVHQVRATLLALQSMPAGGIRVVQHGGRVVVLAPSRGVR